MHIRLEKEQIPLILIAIYRSLTVLGEKRYLAELLQALETTNYRDRCAAANVLLEIIDEHNSSAILKVVNFRMKHEHTKAVRSLLEKITEAPL